MTNRKPWGREELILAINLYCKLPFGRLHQRAPEIVQLARALERTPSSVAMKLCNFASFDPVQQARGIKGLSAVSRADRAIWDEFHSDWEKFGAESEEVSQGIFAPTTVDVSQSVARAGRRQKKKAISMSSLHYKGPTEGERMVRVRYAQSFFRQTVLASYDIRCCITGNPVPELLIASHILPWSEYPEHRVDPRNGICLSRTHDAAFDNGLIAIDDNFRLVLSNHLKDYLPNETLEQNFVAYAGKQIRLPDKFLPDLNFLREHRKRFDL